MQREQRSQLPASCVLLEGQRVEGCSLPPGLSRLRHVASCSGRVRSRARRSACVRGEGRGPPETRVGGVAISGSFTRCCFHSAVLGEVLGIPEQQQWVCRYLPGSWGSGLWVTCATCVSNGEGAGSPERDGAFPAITSFSLK